jgi:predicted xylose isomerase-like sugar epimerase
VGLYERNVQGKVQGIYHKNTLLKSRSKREKAVSKSAKPSSYPLFTGDFYYLLGGETDLYFPGDLLGTFLDYF